MIRQTFAIAIAAAVLTGCAGQEQAEKGAADTGSGQAAISTEAQQRTASGLGYTVLQPGKPDGAVAAKGDTVFVHYTGWLEDGTKFDSSLDRNQPIDFQLGTGAVIRGWDEGIEGMKVGEKRKLVIPGDLAYGPQGRPPTIPPNATLIFETELVDVRKQ